MTMEERQRGTKDGLPSSGRPSGPRSGKTGGDGAQNAIVPYEKTRITEKTVTKSYPDGHQIKTEDKITSTTKPLAPKSDGAPDNNNKKKNSGDRAAPASSVEQNKVLYANPDGPRELSPERTRKNASRGVSPERTNNNDKNPKGVTTKTYILPATEGKKGPTTTKARSGNAAPKTTPQTVVTTTTTKPQIFHQKVERNTTETFSDGTIQGMDREVHLMCCTIM